MAEAGSSTYPQPPLTQDEAGEELFQYLLELKITNKLGAKECCVIAYWAANAGAVGPVQTLGMPPDVEQSGHYSRKFDSAMGTDLQDPNHYQISVPMYLRCEGRRSSKMCATMPVHEAIAKEVDEDER